MIVAGLMSGSSMDGLDIAVVSFDGDNPYQWIDGKTFPLPTSIADRLAHYADLKAVAYLVLERDLSRWMGSTLTQYASTLGVEPTLAGVHGHTLIHTPSKGLTKQLANGGIIAAMAGIDVVTDFRIQDIENGGVGTPLVSILELRQLQGYDYYLNLGGIANITHIHKGNISAFDICPCNQLLNHFTVKHAKMAYDSEGDIARKGSYNSSIVQEMDNMAYWTLRAPKSIDNDWIRKFCLPLIKTDEPLEDILHTLCCWIAKQVANTIKTNSQTKIIVSGGGVHNRFLLEKISEAIAVQNCTLYTGQKHFTDYKEAILMAYMAYLRITNRSNVLAAVTGAKEDTCAGALYKGRI